MKYELIKDLPTYKKGTIINWLDFLCADLELTLIKNLIQCNNKEWIKKI